MVARGAQLQVGKAKDGRNPHALIVSIGGPDLIGSIKVKVEMWQTAEAALSSVKAFVAPVQLARGPGAGMQAFIPVADLTEIYADKVFALPARSFLKPRDVFDLYWLETQAGLNSCSAGPGRLRFMKDPLGLVALFPMGGHPFVPVTRLVPRWPVEEEASPRRERNGLSAFRCIAARQ